MSFSVSASGRPTAPTRKHRGWRAEPPVPELRQPAEPTSAEGSSWFSVAEDYSETLGKIQICLQTEASLLYFYNVT
jgi:hypothetical protein